MSEDSANIVVLDGHPLNPGDLSWDGLRSLGECVVYDRTPPAQVVERARDAAIVLTNKVVLSAEVIARLPKLRHISVLATGFNVVDTAFAREQGIVVSNVPSYGTESVAQMVFAHVLNLVQPVALHAKSVRDGDWASSQDWCYWKAPLMELAGLTMGVVGLGRIGQCTAKLAHAFGMHVLAYDPVAVHPPDSVTMVALRELLQKSDVVSLHCPLTDDTKHLINAETLRLMKRTALLINTSRGALIDESALADALHRGQIAGAGLDVLSMEPPRSDHPLVTAKNCQMTPHIAWATHAARARLLAVAVRNVAAFLAGQPQNVVH